MPHGTESPIRRWCGRLGLVTLGLAAGLAISDIGPERAGGASRGESSARITSIGDPEAVPSRRATGPTPSPNPNAESGLLAAWLEQAEAARLASLAEKVTGAGLDLVARSVIDRLEEDSLKSILASATDFSVDELAEIEDVPGFALDLARIAMEGTVRDAEPPSPEILPIDFATDITWDHRASFPQSQFSVDEPRIYAVFESRELGVGQTLAKWTRVEDGEIMLFKRHRIREVADSSFVYLDAPPGGWAPGEYRVDFYSADRELRWLASGQHRVTL